MQWKKVPKPWLLLLLALHLLAHPARTTATLVIVLIICIRTPCLHVDFVRIERSDWVNIAEHVNLNT